MEKVYSQATFKDALEEGYSGFRIAHSPAADMTVFFWKENSLKYSSISLRSYQPIKAWEILCEMAKK